MSVVTRLTYEDLKDARAILEPSALHIDLEAELKREIALPWVLRPGPGRPPVALLLAWSVADELQLLELASHPEHRRRGHARALLAALVEHARSQRKRFVLLEVRRSNQAAITLYESLGFEQTGERRGYYADNGEDALEMRITLDPETGDLMPSDL